MLGDKKEISVCVDDGAEEVSVEALCMARQRKKVSGRVARPRTRTTTPWQRVIYKLSLCGPLMR